MKRLGLKTLAVVPALVGISLAATMGVASAAATLFGDGAVNTVIAPGATGTIPQGLITLPAPP
jgi:hypothetical protein